MLKPAIGYILVTTKEGKKESKLTLVDSSRSHGVVISSDYPEYKKGGTVHFTDYKLVKNHPDTLSIKVDDIIAYE